MSLLQHWTHVLVAWGHQDRVTGHAAGLGPSTAWLPEASPCLDDGFGPATPTLRGRGGRLDPRQQRRAPRRRHDNAARRWPRPPRGLHGPAAAARRRCRRPRRGPVTAPAGPSEAGAQRAGGAARPRPSRRPRQGPARRRRCRPARDVTARRANPRGASRPRRK